MRPSTRTDERQKMVLCFLSSPGVSARWSGDGRASSTSGLMLDAGSRVGGVKKKTHATVLTEFYGSHGG